MSILKRRRFLLLSTAGGVALLGGLYWRNHVSIDAPLVTDPSGENFAYADGWIVKLN